MGWPFSADVCFGQRHSDYDAGVPEAEPPPSRPLRHTNGMSRDQDQAKICVFRLTFLPCAFPSTVQPWRTKSRIRWKVFLGEGSFNAATQLHVVDLWISAAVIEDLSNHGDGIYRQV